MLVMTSPTHTKMNTSWCNSLRGLFQYLYNFTPRKITFLLSQADTHALAWQTKRDKDRTLACPREGVVETSHRVAAIGQRCENNDVLHGTKKGDRIWVAQGHRRLLNEEREDDEQREERARQYANAAEIDRKSTRLN